MLNRTERKKFSNLTKLIAFCAIPLLSLSTMAKTIIYVANSDTPSVSVFQLELSSGNLIQLQQQLLPNLVKLGPSSPMLITPNKQNLLVVNRGEPKVIFNFSIQAKSGQLSLKSKTALPASMANISTDKTGKLLLAASYPQHLLSVHSLSEQGDVLPQQQVLTDLPNAHASLINKDNRFVFVPALGSDQIRQFKLNLETGQLSPNTPSEFQLEANTGPRHLVEHPNKNMVYLLGEYDATIHVFEYQSTAGTLAKIQQIETAQTDSLKVNGLKHPNQDTSKAKRFWAADIHI
ncbi:lactonase family protein, partial [Catenovulum maritimum]